VVARSVGLFTRNAAGSGPGIVQLYHGTEKPTFNDISNSAIPGDAAVLWGTGLGPVTGDETQQPVVPVPLAANAEVWVGGQQVPPAAVVFQGRSTSTGEDQINFTVPNISGCYVPVFVKVGNIVSNTVSMSIGASGGTCSDPLTNYTGLNLQSNGLRQGSLTLLRIAEQNQLPPFGTMATDAATGLFDSYNWTQLAASRGIGVSVYGACTVYAFSGILATTADIIAPTYLDAGTLSLVGPAGGSPISITATNKGVYNKLLGGSNGFPAPPYLSPGSYTLTGTGGADVGPFTSTLNLPADFHLDQHGRHRFGDPFQRRDRELDGRRRLPPDPRLLGDPHVPGYRGRGDVHLPRASLRGRLHRPAPTSFWPCRRRRSPRPTPWEG